jgi:peptidoglycan/xylan/chitin deacetylase (PgdA/CDA1 family)
VRLATAGGLVAAGAVAARTAPLLGCVRPLRVALWPQLAGVGRHDHVALTFDDGPDPDGTPRVLEELACLDISATFFLLGSMTARHPDVARMITDAGHEIGVHGTLHLNHQLRTPTDVRNDIAQAFHLITDVTGVQPMWFRPPYGALAWASLRAANDLDLRTVLWTTWGRDWRARATPESVSADVCRHLRGGATILLHDSDCTSAPDSWHATLGALTRIDARARSEHLQIGSLRDHGLGGSSHRRDTCGTAPAAAKHSPIHPSPLSAVDSQG